MENYTKKTFLFNFRKLCLLGVMRFAQGVKGEVK